MPGTSSLTRVLSGTLLAVLAATGTAVVVLVVTGQQTRDQLRAAQLVDEATQAAACVRHFTDTMRPGEWTELVANELHAVRAVVGTGSISVMIPAIDAPSRWRLVAATPERPEAILPVADPGVQRALVGSRDLIRWYDPSGMAWNSVVLVVHDHTGKQVALVEARAPVVVDADPEVWWAGGLLALAAVIGVIGVVISRRRSRTGGTGYPSDSARLAAHAGESTPLSGSPSLAAEESTTRRLLHSRELADLRAQAAKFHSADRAKTTLLVALCRSLRQSVDSLRSTSSLIAQTRIDRTQRDYVETLQAGTGDLLARIGDVLDFALLEAECLSLEQRPLRPRLVLEEALLIVAERFVQMPIELAWHADPAVPERVIGDVVRVRQVLVNLVSLAASTAEEGTVCVSLLPEADSRLTFRISLMGVTLTAERVRLLLEGAISSESSSDRLQGEGLGLVLGKRLAQAMGGSLSIERGEGEDIELVCHLRVMPDDVAPDQPLLGRHLIVAHERPATRRMLVSILERAGATVAIAGSYGELQGHLADGPRPEAVVLGTRVAAPDGGSDAPEVIQGVRALAAPWPVVLVVDPVHRGYSAELRSAGALGLVASPVRQQAILAVVADAVSGVKRDSSINPALPAVGAQSRVLVVEDNEVNRLVLIRILESLGITPEIAGNGVEALDQVRAAEREGRPFSLILMDCMMPVMDGLTATRRIRQDEDRDPGVWIVAVTANALANDRVKCLDAGMNDYLAKPITPLALQDAVNRWRQATGLPRKMTLSASEKPALATASSETLDAPPDPIYEPVVKADVTRVSTAKAETFAGLKSLASLAGTSALNEVVGCFIGESDRMLAAVHDAMAAGDSTRLRAAAHKLKGSSGTVGLTAVQAQAALVETAAIEGDLAQARTRVATLDEVFADGLAQLRTFRDGL